MRKRRPRPQPAQAFSFILNLWLGLLLPACSASNNIMGLVARSGIKDDAGALLGRSRMHLDAGAYEQALEDAEAAVTLAPDCGDCAIQAGYCHLAVAGLDMFQLVRKISEKNSTSEATGLIASSNAAGQLSALANLVGLATSDYEAITLPGNRLGELEGAPSTGPFRDLPIYLPKTAPEARVSDSSTLFHIARAVTLICPFMPDDVKILGDVPDIRHADPSCMLDNVAKKVRSNALFIWAMAHLVEAVAFHEVVLYTQDGALPNLQKRAAILEDRTVINSVTEYVRAVKDLAETVDIVLPTEVAAAQASMLTAMFNDLQTVSLAFQHMLAVPPSLTKGIVDAIVDLQGQKSKIGGAAGNKDESSVAFKDQLTEGMAKELKKQMTQKIEAGELSEQERSDLCSAYQQISTQDFESCHTP